MEIGKKENRSKGNGIFHNEEGRRCGRTYSGKKSDGSNEEELEEYKRKIVQEQL